MIHTVYIDDTTIAGEHFMNENRRQRKGIKFANPAITGIIPEGYMTGEDCKRKVLNGLRKRLQENGNFSQKYRLCNTSSLWYKGFRLQS